LLEQFHLPNLANRRVHLKLCTLFKIVHGLLYSPVFGYSVGRLKLLSCKKIHYEQGCH